ncbi:unnamed protein product [Brachionus calyciflorus]|uniref:GPR180/TMEM145 transmembrane domain-containing protein n=1 Tax=Brachionus calyciflorus TaxID=104777 RepID=A0A814LI68_9BILA|nr:unnamed protein product [Brachionus calyciflorus]
MKVYYLRHELICLVLFLFLNELVNGLHLKGTFNTNRFFKFLTRFGMQTTDTLDKYSTMGFIYGNISILNGVNVDINKTLPSNLHIMLTAMDYNYFSDYYNQRRIVPKTDACNLMFEKISKKAYFFGCNEEGKLLDFIRRVPCPNNQLCIDEDKQENVIPGYQFTYKMQDYNQPRFWYLSLVACVRDNCKWKDLASMDGTSQPLNKSIQEDDSPSYTIAYDIWLVNGNPNSEKKSFLEHQFTYELQDITEIYMCSFFIYFFILPFIVHRLKKHFHYLYLKLFIYVSVELTSRFLSIIHTLVYSFDGHGVIFLQFLSDLLEVVASSILILILISVAKGWTIRSKELKANKQSIILGFVLQFVLVLSHMISLETIDPIFNTNSYETVAGYFELGTRFLFMVWFLLELKETFKHLESAALRNELSGDDAASIETKNSNDYQENVLDDDYEIVNHDEEHNENLEKNEIFLENYTRDQRVEKYQKFYLHYGACCLVWFIYLPVLVFITSFVSELFRLRLLLSIRYFVNFISVVVLFYIMWSPKTPLNLPGKKGKKYEFTNIQYMYANDGHDNEDGHIVNVARNKDDENLINFNINDNNF